MKDILPLIKLGSEYVVNEDFSDDFEGNALNADKWYPIYPDWHGRKLGRFVPENVRVENNHLALISRYEDETPVWFKASGYSDLTTACVRSRSRLLYGCIQMRFKANPSAVSNALWLNGSLDADKQNKPGAVSDEIDIFEIFCKSPKGEDNRYFNTCHRIVTPYVEGRVFSGNTTFTRPNTPREAFNFSDDWHTATFLWEKDRLEWYLDGRLTFSHVNDYYHNAMYLNIDSEPLFAWSGEVEPKDLPAEFLVDYIRVWQLPTEGN